MTDLRTGDYVEKGEQVLRIVGVRDRLDRNRKEQGEDHPYNYFFDMIDIQTYDQYREVRNIEEKGYKKIDFSVEYLIRKSNKVHLRKIREIREQHSRNKLTSMSKNFGQPCLF